MKYRKLLKEYKRKSRHGIWLPLKDEEGKIIRKTSKKATAIIMSNCLHKNHHSIKWLMAQIHHRDEINIKNGINNLDVSWKKSLTEEKKVLVFDTETTGFDATKNYVLSLSWQVLDSNLKTIDKQTRYFENPLPESVCRKAIKVNGLTNKKLSELGTVNKKQAFDEFVNTAKDCSLVVGHNVSFDMKFIDSESKRNGIDNLLAGIPTFDTMKGTEKYCNMYKKHGWRKWPKLIELATVLGINTDDINWHHSSSDVEVTTRCFRKIADMA